MTTVTVEQAKMQIGELIAAAMRGEKIIVSVGNQTELTLSLNRKKSATVNEAPKKTLGFGFAKDKITYIADDFDEFDEVMQELFADYI